jgi:hypothetical protein
VDYSGEKKETWIVTMSLDLIQESLNFSDSQSALNASASSR